jgi:hypothetical protein
MMGNFPSMADHDGKIDPIGYWTRVLLVLAIAALFAVLLAWPQV